MTNNFELYKKINRSVFPETKITYARYIAKAIAFKEALEPDFLPISQIYLKIVKHL